MAILHRKARKLTERIIQPVGIKAKIQANMSATDKSVSTTATAIPAKAIKNVSP